jgi:hypothetical protein
MYFCTSKALHTWRYAQVVEFPEDGPPVYPQAVCVGV